MESFWAALEGELIGDHTAIQQIFAGTGMRQVIYITVNRRGHVVLSLAWLASLNASMMKSDGLL